MAKKEKKEDSQALKDAVSPDDEKVISGSPDEDLPPEGEKPPEETGEPKLRFASQEEAEAKYGELEGQITDLDKRFKDTQAKMHERTRC